MQEESNEKGKLIRKIKPKHGNLDHIESDQKGWERGIMVKRREGTRQRTGINDPQTWTTVWELTVEAGKWDGWRRAKGEKLGQL